MAPFSPPPSPQRFWSVAKALPTDPDLGQGLDPEALGSGLSQLSHAEGVLALIVFGSRARGEAQPSSDLDLAVICREANLSPALKTSRWSQYRQVLGAVGQDVDLLVLGQADATRMAGSRWHVMGDVAREGRVLYAAC
ncbi:MAG: nucleotidyltransferase domain-containing protein [Cyanobacteria bacterium]|nr:nucleotidyltransferase domain-containing protein [Cyanobacteriota bacterium]